MAEKTVLITGSSKGLGKRMAITFSNNKYNVILHGRDEQRLTEVESAVLENGVECDVVKGDITLVQTINSLYEAAERRDLDVLINNVGIYANKPFQEMSIDEFRRIIEVNLITQVILTKRVFPIFQKKKAGLIININSAAGKNSSDGECAYSASKHGLRGFARSFQFEANRDNVRIMDIYLGAMKTSMVKDRIEHEKFIQTLDAAALIFRLSQNYPSMRINEIDLGRRNY